MPNEETNVPDLPTPEAINEALTPEPSDPFESLTPEAREAVLKILPELTAKANQVAEANYAKRLQEAIELIKTDNEKQLQEFYKQNKPLEPIELEQLLSEEYLEFKVPIPAPDGELGNGNKIAFVIRELTQAKELKFLRYLKKELVPHI